jgi:hypothetical protein
VNGIGIHFTCAKGNAHWLSHGVDWDGDQCYGDRCRVHITVEGGHQVHLTVLPDMPDQEVRAASWVAE